jgi:Carboxypeptidase regulatory-like domain
VKRTLLRHAVRLVLLAALAAHLHAGARPQAPTVSLVGTVTDPAGAAVAGARIQAVNQATGQSFTTSASASGQFSFPALPPGRYTVTVSKSGFSRRTIQNINLAAGEPRELNIRLRLGTTAATVEVSPAPRRITGRYFMVGWTNEQAGYGLYSYLLLAGKPVSDDARKLDRAVIGAYLQALPDISAFEGHFPKAQLNITYMLVSRRPPAHGPNTDWVLDHYEFPRARVLLNMVPGATQNGPYIISSSTPLSHSPALPEHYLFQDMSDVPPALAGMWEERFEAQASKPDFWKPDTRAQWVLELRTLIAQAAHAGRYLPGSRAEILEFLGLRITWH